jgi:hypothetical protein
MHGQFQFAQLLYGSSRYRVQPNQYTPLPESFDFEHPEKCARKIFAIMSNASGGHLLLDCKVRFHKLRGTANLTCGGAHIFFQTPNLPKLSIDEVCDVVLESTVLNLGHVVTDQYGRGWERAKWRDAE